MGSFIAAGVLLAILIELLGYLAYICATYWVQKIARQEAERRVSAYKSTYEPVSIYDVRAEVSRAIMEHLKGKHGLK